MAALYGSISTFRRGTSREGDISKNVDIEADVSRNGENQETSHSLLLPSSESQLNIYQHLDAVDISGKENASTFSYGQSNTERNKSDQQLLSISKSWKPLMVITLTLLTLVAYISTMSGMSSSSQFAFSSETDLQEKNSAILILVSNEYGDVTYDKYPYPFLKDNLFAEVYKNNSLRLSDVLDTSDCVYSYVISSADKDAPIVQQGLFESGVAYFKPTVVGEFSLSMTAYCSNQPPLVYPSMTIFAKYVRRNIFDLTLEDREIFLDAFHTLWTVNTSYGKRIYGEEYRSMNYFVLIHNDGSTSNVYDQFHSDVGFFPNHMWMVAYVEQSLQAVDPRTCLPVFYFPNEFASPSYMNHVTNQLDGGKWSRITSDEFFGSSDPHTGRIINSRWENATLPQLTGDFFYNEEIDSDVTFFPEDDDLWYASFPMSHLFSPYGLLREANNYNPSPYLTRYHNFNLLTGPELYESIYNYAVFPDSFYSVYENSNGTDMTNLLNMLYANLHNPVHHLFGGSGGPGAKELYEYLKGTFNVSDVELFDFADSYNGFKMLQVPVPGSKEYHGNSLQVSCMDTPWSYDTSGLDPSRSPTCYCNPWYMTSHDGMDEILDTIFGTGETALSNMKSQISSLDMASKAEALNKLCGSFVFTGDFYSKSSAPDPLFWVFHSQIERIFQKIIFDDRLIDFEYSSTSTVSGHSDEGTCAWLEGFKLVDKSLDIGLIPNAERFHYLVPFTDEYRDNMKYIYDHSDWDSFFEIETGWTGSL